MRQQQAMSLIECLIALSLGSAILFMTATWVINSTQQWQFMQVFVEVTGNQRWFAQFIRHQWEESENHHCIELSTRKRINTDIPSSFLQPFLIVDNKTDISEIESFLKRTLKQSNSTQSNSIIINYSYGDLITAHNVKNDNNKLCTQSALTIKQNQTLIVVDDKYYQLSTVTDLDDQNCVTLADPISNKFHPMVQVKLLRHQWLHIKDTDRRHPDGQHIMALAKQQLDRASQYHPNELLEGVRDLQFEHLADNHALSIEALFESMQPIRYGQGKITFHGREYHAQPNWWFNALKIIVANSRTETCL